MDPKAEIKSRALIDHFFKKKKARIILMEMKDEGPVKIVQAKARSRSNKKEVIDVFNEIR